MKQSIVRSVKYFLFLVIMFAIVYAIMLAMGVSDVPVDRFGDFLSTSRGQMMIVAIIGLAALYPFYGVTTKKMRHVGTGDIVIAMQNNGYKLIKKEENVMIFKAVSFADRLKLRFDDTIEVDSTDHEITKVTGARKAVYSIIYKLGGEVL